MSAFAKQSGKRLEPGIAGAALAVGDLVYLGSDGRWELADADSVGLYPAQGVVTMAASADGEPVEVCQSALIGGLTGLTVGAALYLSTTGTTGNTITETRPTAAFDCVQGVGYNKSATEQAINIAPIDALRPS